MKKRILGLVLSVAMVASLLAGCGSSSEAPAADTAAATTDTAAADTDAAATTAAEAFASAASARNSDYTRYP